MPGAPVALIDFHTGIHILKPFLEPVQRLLLGLLLPLRALRALSNGRADPVATATLAAACLAVGLGTMIYAHFIHSYVMWLLGWFFTILLYIIGVALFGPQNYFLVKAHVKKKRERQRLRALAGFDPNGHAALQIQDFYRAIPASAIPCPTLSTRHCATQASTPRS